MAVVRTFESDLTNLKKVELELEGFPVFEYECGQSEINVLRMQRNTLGHMEQNNLQNCLRNGNAYGRNYVKRIQALDILRK